MATKTLALALLGLSAGGLPAAGEETCDAGTGEAVSAHSLLQAKSQRGSQAQLMDAEALETVAQGPLWQLHAINKQCGRWNQAQNKYNGISSPDGCQAKAVANGHAFFTYKANQKKCQTSSHCDNIRSGNGWKIYEAPSAGGVVAAPEPTPEPTSGVPLWELHAINKQCGRWNQAQDKYNGISSPEGCQAKAVANGHAFFTYRANQKKCQTSSHCDNIRSGSGWKIYEAPANGGPVATPEPTLAPTPEPTSAPTPEPSSAPTPEPESAACGVSSITIFTGAEPTDMSWKIVGETIGGELHHCEGGDYTSADEEVNVDCCLSPGTFLLTNNDAAGNGMSGGYVELRGLRLFDAWSGFQKEETIRVLQPASGADDSCMVSSVHIFTGSFPGRIQWKIIGKSEDDDMVSCQGGDYSSVNSDESTDCCLPPGGYKLTCMDSEGGDAGWSDGFLLLGGHKLCDSSAFFLKDQLLIA